MFEILERVEWGKDLVVFIGIDSSDDRGYVFLGKLIFLKVSKIMIRIFWKY